MKAKLGMSPIAWWNDDLVELSDDVSLEECLRQSRSAGFTGMEKGRRFPDDPAMMLPILKRRRRDAVRRVVFGDAGRGRAGRQQGPHSADDRAVQGRQRALHRLWRSGPLDPGRSRDPLAQKPKLTDDEMKAYGRKVTMFGEMVR